MNYKVASLATLAVMGLVAGSTAGPATASATHWRHNEPRFVQVQADEDSHGDLTISFVEKGLNHQRFRIYATGLASVDHSGDNGDGNHDHGGGGGWGRVSGGWGDQDSQKVRSEVLRGWARHFVDDEVTLMAPDNGDHGDGGGDHGGGGGDPGDGGGDHGGGGFPGAYDHTDEVTWQHVVLRDSATGAHFKVTYIHHEDSGGDPGDGGGDHGGGGDGGGGGGDGGHGGGGWGN